MIFCILDLLILVWDIVIIVHAFVTKNVIWTTWSLMAVALWLLVTIILNLKNDIEERAWDKVSDLEDKVKQLEAQAQIEKMKCPQNCKNGSVYNWSDNSICMDCEKVRTLHEDNWQEMCKGCKYWELRR